METLKLEDIVKTVDTLLAAGKTPAMWERLKHLSGEALAKEQLKALEGISKGLLDYANTNGIGKELWDEATQEAAIMNGYEWRYIHQGLMHEAIKTVREKRIIAGGYNGSISGDEHCIEQGCYVVDNHCVRTVHAETNALLQCAKYGTPANGADLYVTHFLLQLQFHCP